MSKIRNYPSQGEAKGWRYSAEKVGTSIKFDLDTWNEIAKNALKNCVTFSEQVRTYCEWGLETEKDEAP